VKSVSESLIWELCNREAKSLNLFEGKYFAEKGAGLSLYFVLKNKNNKSNSCFIGSFFVCKQRTFLV